MEQDYEKDSDAPESLDVQALNFRACACELGTARININLGQILRLNP